MHSPALLMHLYPQNTTILCIARILHLSFILRHDYASDLYLKWQLIFIHPKAFFPFSIVETKAVFGCWKSFSRKYIFSGNTNFRKRKMYLGVWLFRKSFYGKSIPVFDSSKYFMEIVLRKFNSGVWFVQIFYGKYFTENVFPCLVRKILYEK